MVTRRREIQCRSAASSFSGWMRPYTVITLFSAKAKQPLKVHLDGKWRLVITKIGLHLQENWSSLVKMELSSSDDLFWNQTAGGRPYRGRVSSVFMLQKSVSSGQAAVIRSANNNPKNYIPAFTKGRNPPPCWATPSVSVSHWWQTVFARYQKHHFAYNHTSSCCCHGDGRLKRYASDCLSGALCLSARGPPLIHVAISSIGLGGVALGRVWGTLGPAWLRAARTTAPLLIAGCYCSSGERLHAPAFF